MYWYQKRRQIPNAKQTRRNLSVMNRKPPNPHIRNIEDIDEAIQVFTLTIQQEHEKCSSVTNKSFVRAILPDYIMLKILKSNK